MGSCIRIACLVAAAGAGGPTGIAADAGRSLAAWFQPAAADGSAVDASDQEAAADGRTPYVAGMIGSSFAANNASAGSTLFAGQGAVGVSVPRPLGGVRVELEGRQRAALSGTRPPATPNPGSAFAEVTIGGAWTTMANAWRDVVVAEHLTLYGGGGFGVGGYAHDADAAGPASPRQVTAFGWQAGGGVAYAVTDRLTLDMGGRWYGLEAGARDGSVGPPVGEIVFAVRIADPFRGWLGR